MRFIWPGFLKLSLWLRVAIAVTLGFLALFVAYAILGEQAIQDSTDRVLGERLVIAELAADEIDHYLAQAITQLERLPPKLDFQALAPDSATSFLTRAYSEIGIFEGGLVFLDADGHVILTQPPDLYAVGEDLSDLSYVAQELQQQKALVSEPFLHPLDQQPVTAVVVPYLRDDHLTGIIVGLLKMRDLNITSTLDQVKVLGETGHAVLMDADGRAIVSTFNLPFLSPGEHQTFYREAMAAGEPIIKTVLFELDLPNEPVGHQHIMGFAPLKNAPWGVAVGGDVLSETFAGIERLRNGLVVLGLTSLVAILLATLTGTRRLVRPVLQLTVSAQQIADGDLEKPLLVHEGGEIGAMSEALEHMRQQLLANINELARWNEELEGRVQEQTEALRHQQELTQQLLRRTIKAQEDERARLSWELHDEIGQVLTAVELSLERLQKAIPPDNHEMLERVERSRILSERAVTDLRRLITALRPSVLDDLGLIPALEWMSDHTLRPLGIAVNLENRLMGERLPGETEIILFRIAQEAMNNVARHSQAQQLNIKLYSEPDSIKMTLADNGRGFESEQLATRLDTGRGLGLAGMQERASLVGGQVNVESIINQGTIVYVTVPRTAQAIKEE